VSRLKLSYGNPYRQDGDEMERTNVRCYSLKFKSVKGGITAWSEEIDSKVPRY
jgi:hypothetical protein